MHSGWQDVYTPDLRGRYAGIKETCGVITPALKKWRARKIDSTIVLPCKNQFRK
jgi:hypothetical protein